MNYELIIWDFDGTLADTLQLALEIYNEIARDKGFLPITDPHAVRDLSMSEFLAAHRIPAHRIPGTFSRFLSEVHGRSATLLLNPGIAETVSALHSLNITQGVVSSNQKQNIENCLHAHGLRDCFKFIVGTSRLFGKSRSVRKASRAAGIDTNRVLYVGDEIRDIEAAEAAGTDVAAVTWGLNSASALGARNPTWLVESPHEILTDVLGQSQSVPD